MTLDLSVLDEGNDFASTQAGASEGVPRRAPVDCFDLSPSNPRFEEDEAQFKLLVEDVAFRGLLQPVVVRREHGRLQICFGSRRYRAAIAAGLQEIPYVVTEDPRQLDDYAQVAENERRQAMQPLELATFAARKIAQGESKADVARRLGMHASSLIHLLSLADTPPPFILDLYHSRRCRTPVYLYRLKLLWKRNAGLVEAACSEGQNIDLPVLDALARAIRNVAASVDVPAERNAVAPSALRPVPRDSTPVASVAAAGSAVSDAAQDSVPARLLPPLRNPVLRGSWRGMDVVILFRRSPSRTGVIAVSGHDPASGASSEFEIPIDEIVLVSLCDSA